MPDLMASFALAWSPLAWALYIRALARPALRAFRWAYCFCLTFPEARKRFIWRLTRPLCLRKLTLALA